MRVSGGVALWIVATLAGAFAAFWFALAGLGWSDGFIKRGFWEEGEGEIGVAFGVFALGVWLILLTIATAVLRRGSGAERGLAIVLTVVSVGVVATLCVLAIAWPEPPSEYPLPPWNRA